MSAMLFCTEVTEHIKWRSVVLSPVSDRNFWLALLSGDRDQMGPMGWWFQQNIFRYILIDDGGEVSEPVALSE